ncbi:putative alpha-L-arabinofuranosidase A [Lachnellula occidentalis]|uniref:non-reducing end alpha-L-arabinofuranosidase n=1 Tax=Lachnellula occidentalis TaxID=215460 RepID=A0A8H8SAP4_9HELO|nr:putative alpha-L-arabinofuranosidase A [Lachnellula occidentalis]
MFSSASLLLLTSFVTSAYSATFNVSTTGGNASSPLLYGLMFEDINNSGDGGIHGQLLKNNGFQGDSPGLTAYASVGGTSLSQDTTVNLTTAIQSSLKVSVPSGTTASVGFSNSGYGGVPVNAGTYANYFYIKGNYSGTVTLRLVGSTSGTVFASHDVTVTSSSAKWTYVETSFTASQSSDRSNVWQLLFDGSKVAGSALWFDLVQSFPATYHGRFNGIRNDVGEFLEAIGGSSWEGGSPGARWNWNETIGPLENRPGRQGDWSYPNTDALGLMEYLQWCDDMSLTPVLAIWSGLSLGGGIISGTALTPYVEDALNELEFLLGSTSTTTLPSGIWTDIHHYESPSGFVSSFNEFDNYPRIPGYGIFVGEYANTETDSGTQLLWSNTAAKQVQGAISEAVYMIGLERNSDLVKLASYAPILEHFGLAEWPPDLVGLSSAPNPLTGSISYYVQKLFSTARGDTIRAVSADVDFGPLYWVASSTTRGKWYVKIANYGMASQNATVKIPSASGLSGTAAVQVLSGSAGTSNGPAAVSVQPVNSTLTGSATAGWTFDIPAYGVAVFTASPA